MYNQAFVSYFWLFLLGAFVAEKRNMMLPALRKYWAVFLLISAVMTVLDWDINAQYGVIGSTTLVLGLIGFAYQFPVLNIKTDISYGIYIYHMIVVNGMIALGVVGKPICLLIVIVMSCLLAFVSERTAGHISVRKKNV